MRKSILCLAIVAAFGAVGCNTFTGAESGVRVVEYGGGGIVAPISGEAGGVAVHKWGAEKDAAVLVCRQSDKGAAMVKSGKISDGAVAALCGREVAAP